MEQTMTLANNYNPTRQLANGVTTSFSFNYDMINSDYAAIYQEVDGVQTLVDSELYTIEFDDNGGNVVFKTAPAAGVYIVVGRNVPTDQETPYRTSSGFPANRVEENLDKLTAITQQLSDESNRSPKTPIGMTGINLNLPAPSAGKALVWNQTADALVNSTINVDDTVEEVTAQADRAESKANEAANSESAAAESASAAAASEQNAAASAAAAAESAASVDGNKIKQIAYENQRVVQCNGATTVQLADNYEVISLVVNAASTIQIDTSLLTFPKKYYTVQFDVTFPAGAQTVTLALSNEGTISWINALTPDFSSGKEHWLVLRAVSGSMDVTMSDAGEVG